MPISNIDLSRFSQNKQIKIFANSYFDAFSQLALRTRTDLDLLLDLSRKNQKYLQFIEKAKKSLQVLLAVRKNSNYFGNHLENYLESFCGYCQGASISLDEGALLQLEIVAGCQSLAVQNSQNSEIWGFHTEEDSTAYDLFGESGFGKYWVEMTLPNKKVSFLHYVGLCGYGYSYTVTPNLFNISDVLGSIVEGNIWSHIVNFSMMNSNSIDEIKLLVANLSNLSDPKFREGYTTTIMDFSSPPRMLQVEFGGNLIIANEAKMGAGYSYYSGINYPNNEYLRSIDVALQEESLVDSYLGRFARLENSAMEIGKLQGVNFETIQKALRNPDGEWREEWFTGFSNCYVANHIMFNIDGMGNLTLKLIDGNPL